MRPVGARESKFVLGMSFGQRNGSISMSREVVMPVQKRTRTTKDQTLQSFLHPSVKYRYVFSLLFLSEVKIFMRIVKETSTQLFIIVTYLEGYVIYYDTINGQVF